LVSTYRVLRKAREHFLISSASFLAKDLTTIAEEGLKKYGVTRPSLQPR
jgi:hypothetical protein